MRAYALPQSPGEGLSPAPSNIFVQRLGVATSRALERRLGRPPSQADVCGVVNSLTSRSSRFLACAERAQARLARLHLELQKSQEDTDTAMELIVTPIEPSKRHLEESDYSPSDPHREVKRVRLESGNPNPQNSPPPSKPEKPENVVHAPNAPMPQKHASVAPQGTPFGPQSVAASHADSPSPHARVDIPKQTPVTDIEQSTSSDLPKSSKSDHEIKQRTPQTVDAASHGDHGSTEGASPPACRDSLPAGPLTTQTTAQETAATAPPSAANSVSVRQQSPLTGLGTRSQHVIGSRTDLSANILGLPGFAAAMDLSVFTQPPPAPPLIANVPGIWVIQVGKPSPCQVDVSFEVDQDTAVCIRRWATRSQGFEYAPPLSPFVLHATAPFLPARTSEMSSFTWSLCRPL